MKKLLLALALVSSPVWAKAPAPFVCPDKVGKVNKVMIDLYANFVGINLTSFDTYQQKSIISPMKEALRKSVEYRNKELSERVNLGYKQLDAGCHAEARETFQYVWAWNGPDYIKPAGQAREALNMMNLKP